MAAQDYKMAINSAIYSKVGTASGTATAISTTNPEKYDSMQVWNDHASVTLVCAVNGASVSVLPGESIGLDIRHSPNSVKVSGNGATYRIVSVGR
jgi:hypothetical protein